MYQGVGGPGQGPARNPGRTTGTIPRNNSSNDASFSFRQNEPLSRNMMPVRSPFASSSVTTPKPASMNAPKNQVPLSWSAENTTQRDLHKNGPSNTFEPCRPAPDGWDAWNSGAPNNSYSLSGGRSLGQVHPDSETNGFGEAASLGAFFRPNHSTRINGHDHSAAARSSSAPFCSSQVNNETCRNEIHDQSRQCDTKKTNNIPRMNCCMDGSASRSVQSPSLPISQPASLPMSNVSLNGQGDAVNKSSEFYNRNELKLKLEEEERKLRVLQEKQSVLLRRRKQTLNSPFENHRPDACGQAEVFQRDRAVDGRPSDSNRSSDLHSLQTNGHFVADAMELRDGESSEDSAVEDSYDDYMEAHTRAQVQGQIVRDKLAEINCLRAQLKQVKGLINMAQRSPGASVRSESSSTVNADFGPSEQAVNIRRQRSSQAQDERQSQTAANRRPDSKQSNACTKAEELENEKARLRHLQALIARVQEFHSANLPIPEYLLAELKSETEDGSSARQNANAEGQRLQGERPVSPSDQDAVGEDYGDNEDVDNDENAVAVRHHEPNEVMSASFSQEPSSGRRTKAVNVGGDYEHELDVASRGDLLLKFERPMEGGFRRSTGPSTAWENVTSSTPLSNEDVAMPSNVDNEAETLRHPSARDHDCSCCQFHQRQQQDSQLQDFPINEPRAPEVHHNNGSALPDVRGVWSSVPESEDISNSTNYPVDSRYQNVRQDNNSASSSTVNLFSHAQEVQNRLRALAQSYQGLLAEGHMEVLPGNRPDQIYAAMMANLPPSINIPPPSSVAPNNCDREHYYQQLLAASQLQYQQVLVTAVNQCYHLLWLQHQELANLRSTVHMLTSNGGQLAGLAPRHPQEPWGISPPSPAPVPPTLNNQVPPGNRTNNYWDNFRSYSRQNLLSGGQAKSNEVFPHNPSPLTERSHNALHPLPSAPVATHPAGAAPAAPVPAIPVLSPLTGTPGQSAGHLMGAVGPLATTSFGPLPATGTSHHPEGLDVDAAGAPLSESAHICRKDKRNTAFQEHLNQQPAQQTPQQASQQGTAARNDRDANRAHPSEVSSSGVCDVHPVLLQEHSPPDVGPEVPLPMPFLRSHISLYHRLSNPVAQWPSQSDVATRCPDTRNATRNQLSMTAEPYPMHENVNDTNANQGRNWNPRPSEGSSTWVGRQNWNNTSWTPNFQTDQPSQSAHSMPDFRFNNVSVPEQPGAVKRNSCIQKRSGGLTPVNQTNYQRNIHGAPALRNNSAAVSGYQHHNSLAATSNECESHKLAKNQPLESSRNFLRSEGQAERRGMAEAGDQEEQPLRCNSARQQATLSESDLQCEMNKNHLKENRLQMSKSPKYNSKPVAPMQAAPQPGNIRTVSKSNQAGGISKRNQDSAKPSSSTPNYPEDIREAVLAEVASLMSANENQPQFLAQLLRSLQLVSSDTQTENASQVPSNVDSQQNEEATSTGQAGTSFENDERHAVKDTKPRRARRTTPSEERQANSAHDRACSLPECETRGAPPSDSGDKFKDLAVELSAYIRAHLHDTCTSSMIDEICSLVLMFVPFTRHVSGRTNPSQLEGLLGNALHRFQGRRLEAVCDELTSVILKVLTNEMSFVHLIDTLDQNNHEASAEGNGIAVEAGAHSAHAWPYNDSGAIAGAPSTIAIAESSSSPPLMREPDELLEIGLVSELASNGDLAEADQSHSSSLVNGEVVLNRSLVHGGDVAAMEDEDLNAIGNSAAEENGVSDSRPMSCEPAREHEPPSAPDRGQPESAKATSHREQLEGGDGSDAAASSSQEWEENSEEHLMAAQGVDHGLDQVPIRLANEHHANQTFSDSTSQ